jgi:hypothetical protein
MNETTFKNGHLICPLGTGRYGVRQPVFLIVRKNAEGTIMGAFFRVRFDGHVVEAANRKELKAKVDATFNNNKDQRWTKFLIPNLSAPINGVSAKPRGYHKAVANANCFLSMEPSIRGAKTPGTRLRHENHDKPGTYSQENQVAISDSGHGDYLPDTPAVRKQMAAIQDELTRASRKADRALARLIQRNKGKSGEEYLGDKK